MKLPLLQAKTLLGASLLLAVELRSEVVVDPSFQGALTGDGAVYTLQLDSNGNVFIGGQFTEINNTSRGNLARLETNGALDQTFQPVVNGEVKVLQVNEAGEILVGGNISSINGQQAFNLARLLTGGGLDTTFTPQLNYSVRSAVCVAEGGVVVGGNFTQVNGNGCEYVGSLDGFGTGIGGFNSDIHSSEAIESGVYVVAVGVAGKIFVGGNFNTSRGFETIARLNPNGSLDTSFSASYQDMLYPTVIVPIANGQVIVAGVGSPSGEAAVKRFNTDGTWDESFNAPALSGVINALVLQPDGKMIVGGRLSGTAGTCGVIRLNEDGSLDSSFSIPVSGVVNALALQSDGKLIVAGGFDQVNGVARNGIARIVEKSFGFHSFRTSSNGAFSATLEGQAGKTYVIESSSDLQNWSTFSTNTATNAGLEVTDNSTGKSRKFFRAKLAP